MTKIDRRKHYILMLDTETCNGYVENGRINLNDSLVYDIGGQIIDKTGKVYEKFSFVISDIFYGESKLMKSAYYAKKLPQYHNDIATGDRLVTTFLTARKYIKNLLETYGTNTVCAHNARFDLNALNTTARYITKSNVRYFFPYGTEIWDTLKMANDVICKTPSYINFCNRNGYLTKHSTPRPRATAEILFRYISGNEDFVEKHTGLEDVKIETKILAYCMRKHKKMQKKLFA